MNVVFFSNYLTHHQIPFCEAMCKIEGMDFTFVSTMPMEQERKDGGWELGKAYPYELKAYADEDSAQKAMELAKNSDVMIIGSAPETYVKARMRAGKDKLTLRYSERIYKTGRWRALSPRGALNRFNSYFRYIGKPLYMLCASAYTAGDLAMLGSYLGRCYKWGYFPATKTYDSIDEIMEQKEKNTLLWTARFIDWKHPEIPVEIARRLKTDGYDFRLDMIGTGVMKEEIQTLIDENDLQDQVKLLGTMSPEEVRHQMEKHQLFLFTSDQNEGWGAVLNEAMNSACCTVADGRIGSVPFMVQHGKNGYVYQKGSVDQLYNQVKDLLDHPEKTKAMGKCAYETVVDCWSAEPAAKRLIALIQALQQGKKTPYKSGPCSKAPVKNS